MNEINTYNPEGSDLRKAQLRMLDILLLVTKICDNNNIQYWLAFGTLLGAVRHKGFIPWDDDLDIEVEKKDYNKLIEILKKELPQQFIVQDKTNEPNYFLGFSKVRDKYSITNEENSSNFNEKGIFIDIFYREKSNYLFRKISTKILSRSLEFLYLDKHNSKHNNSVKIFYLKSRVLIHSFFVFLIRLIFKCIPNSKYYLGLPIIAKPIGFKKHEIFPLKKIEFEGFLFNAPNNTDLYLTKYYNDYMQIPSSDKIFVHSSQIIFLDDK